MTVLNFKTFKVVDRNENDLFDAQDKILNPKGAALINLKAAPVQETFKKLGVSSLEEIQSLEAAAQYLHWDEPDPRKCSTAVFPSERWDSHTLKTLARVAGIPGNANFMKALEERIEALNYREKLEAAQRMGDLYIGFSGGVDELMADPPAQVAISSHQLSQIRKGLLVREFHGQLSDAENLARGYFPPGAKRGSDEDRMKLFKNLTGAVEDHLDQARSLAARSEISSEVRFDEKSTARFLKAAPVTAYRLLWKEARAAAAWGRVEEMEKYLQAAKQSLKHPELQGHLSWNENEAQALTRHAIKIGFRQAVGLARTRGHENDFEDAINRARELSSRPEVMGKLSLFKGGPSFDEAQINRLRRLFLLRNFTSSLNAARDFAGRGEGGLAIHRLKNAEDNARRLKAMGFLSPEIENLPQFRKRIIDQCIDVALKRIQHWEAGKVTYRSFVDNFSEWTSLPEFAGKIPWDKETAKKIRGKAVFYELRELLREADPRFDGSERLQEQIIKLIREPEFDPLQFKTHLGSQLSRKEILLGYQLALRAAKSLAFRCTFSDTERLLLLAQYFRNHPKVENTLGMDEKLLDRNIRHSVQLGYDETRNVACAKHSRFSTGLALQERTVLQLIENNFKRAENAAERGDPNETIKALKEAQLYSRLADTPFDNRRYGKILRDYEESRRRPILGIVPP